MPPIRAQTSTEVKKAYKKSGPVISERTHKQLVRGHELEQRAAREREAEKRRRAAKERREERERKEKAVRQQLGVGLATQLIGYSHTQAKLKSGMEAFLGVGKKKSDQQKREEQKKEEEELTKKLEAIAQDVEKELFDDDDMDDAMLDLPALNASGGEGWVDDDLDDDTLLEAHDLVMSDPIEEPKEVVLETSRPALAPPVPRWDDASVQPPKESSCMPMTTPSKTESPLLANPSNPSLPKPNVTSEDQEFTRTHGPINKVIETVLERVPGEIVELLSQDSTTSSPDWHPAQGLLHKLNPIGLPPHRLRLKVGCVVVLLRDLNTSSQLSKSQHVRVLRVGNERLDCITLDGQLAGTNTVITRVPFPAKYRNDDKFPFTRTQYPVRVATDYTSQDAPRETAQTGFKLPSINGRMRPPPLVKRTTPPSGKAKSQGSLNPEFKLPGLPASKVQAAPSPKPSISLTTVELSLPVVSDGWDDFLDSGTQIARELLAEATQKPLSSDEIIKPPPTNEPLPPFSTQDLDFSLDDLDDEPPVQAKTEKYLASTRAIKLPPSVRPGPLSRTANIRRIDVEPDRRSALLHRPSKSVQVKSKRLMPPPPPPKTLPTPTKHINVPSPLSLLPPAPSLKTVTSSSFNDFGMSTQDATSFFDDDDDFAFGSPPITV